MLCITCGVHISRIILKESASSSEDQEDRRMMIQHKFNKFTHWGLEHVPGADNCTQKSLAWLELSRVLHSPVDE
ncbi:RNASEH2C [Bugula neritina]|uniref:RNASEH2C n=1 Tax=Bugula neritina TaxID=10212 RepID=A0A7J7JI24_BUGNE|nr:RNASEH2C [Bugula neritina]